MKEFLMEHIAPHISAFIGAILSAVVGFLFGRKKQKAEVESLDIDNTDKLVKTYRESLDDLTARYEKKFQEIISLYEQKVQLLNDEISLHKRINEHLKEENELLRNKLKDRL